MKNSVGSIVVVRGICLCVKDFVSVGVMNLGIFEKLFVVMCWLVFLMCGLVKWLSIVLW